jgi:uncharacterized protein YoxC
MTTALVIIGSLIVATGLVYILTKLGNLKDVDNDGIPDVLEDKVKDIQETTSQKINEIKEVVKEVNKRVENMKDEANDLVNAVKEVNKQAKHVVNAAKGEPKKGRPRKK